MLVLALALGFIFAALALLHVYWACGGTWAVAVTIPQTSTGQPVLRPGPLGCLVVAFGLGAFGWVCLARVDVVPAPVSPGTLRAGLWAIAGLLGLRAVGEFRYVGVTRRVRGTAFANWDRRLYTPVSLALALAVAILAVSTR